MPKTLTEVLAEKKSYPLSPISKKALSGDYNQPIRLPQFSCDKKGSFYEGSGKVVGFRQGRIEVERKEMKGNQTKSFHTRAKSLF